MIKDNQKIWLSAPHMSGLEMKYIEEAFSNGHVFPMGPNVEGFETDLCTYVNIEACTCLSSGTAGIHLALIVLGVEMNDEVICSTFTFSASANPILYQKAIPVFIDSEEDTWNMDPRLLERAIEDRIKATGRKPKAIIVVHLYGMPAKMQEILDVANGFDIPVIEDAAEALGSVYYGKFCGTLGQIGVFSFNGNKIITSSGGGALVSSNKAFCQKALFLATQAKDPAPYYQHSEVGYNYRMSNISAGIGRGQMEVLAERVIKRRSIFTYYQKALQDVHSLQFLEETETDVCSNRWLSCLISMHSINGWTPGKLVKEFASRQIEVRRVWKPMHLQPVFAQYPSYINGVSEMIFDMGVCLPSSSNLTRDQQDHVIEQLISIIR